MADFSFYDISTVLVEHHKLDPNTAYEFVRTIFDIIQERLTIEQQVKVKGLGTFKVVKVDARESIDVNTGERILIDGHQKISFTPDSAMKELINKPFSQFETVILNEGVNFDDAATVAEPATPDTITDAAKPDTITDAAKPAEEHITEPAQTQPEAIIQEPETDVAQETIQEEKQETITIQQTAPQTEPVSVPETILSAIQTPIQKTPQEAPSLPEYEASPSLPHVAEEAACEAEERAGEEPEDEDTPSQTRSVIVYVACTIILAALAAFGGYWYGMSQSDSKLHADRYTEQSVQPKAKAAEVKPAAAKQQTKPDTTATAEKKDTTKQRHAAEPSIQPETATHEQYAKMDIRVRTGAYKIVGEDFTATVNKGETMTRLAKRTLGDGMECYIEVFNGIQKNTPLTEGQKIKIPKLRLKKR